MLTFVYKRKVIPFLTFGIHWWTDGRNSNLKSRTYSLQSEIFSFYNKLISLNLTYFF